MGFGQFIIFRHGLLVRQGCERTNKKILVKLLGFFNSISILKRFKPIPTEVLAMKLAKTPGNLPPGTSVLKLQEIAEF